MEENKNCTCGSEIGEYLICCGLAAIFIWVWLVFFKPFEGRNLFIKFLGGVSIIFLLFTVFICGLMCGNLGPSVFIVLIFPGGVYLVLVFLACLCPRE